MGNYLKKLYKKLSFLEEDEREKIVESYRKKIEKRFKSGKTLKESIKEVGSIDSIVRQICKERNLNYDYCVKSNSFDKNVSNVAKIIGNFIRELMKIFYKATTGFSLQSVLEVCVKFIILIVVYFIIKLPCILLQNLVEAINRLLFYPYNSSFDIVINVVISMVYLITCIIITLKVFGTQDSINKRILKEDKSDKLDKDYKWLDIIIRIVIYLIILIPLGLLGLIILVALIGSVFLVYKGIDIVGLTILLSGIFGMIGSLFFTIQDSLNHKNNTYLAPLIISIIIFISGIIVTSINFSNFRYPTNLDGSKLVAITESEMIELYDSNTKLVVINGDYQIIVDNELSDTELLAQVTYYDEYVDVVYNQVKENDLNQLLFDTKQDKNINYFDKLDYVFEDLKNGYMFDYSNTNKIKLKIYVNEKVKNMIEVSNG